jgi:hypothetical protein
VDRRYLIRSWLECWPSERFGLVGTNVVFHACPADFAALYRRRAQLSEPAINASGYGSASSTPLRQ